MTLIVYTFSFISNSNWGLNVRVAYQIYVSKFKFTFTVA